MERIKTIDEILTGIALHGSNADLTSPEVCADYEALRTGERGDRVIEITDKAIANSGVGLETNIHRVRLGLMSLISLKLETELAHSKKALERELDRGNPRTSNTKTGAIPGAYLASGR